MELHNLKINNGRGAVDGPLITLRKVGKSYVTPAGPYPALRDIDLETRPTRIQSTSSRLAWIVIWKGRACDLSAAPAKQISDLAPTSTW
jgi:hypothetical protein